MVRRQLLAWAITTLVLSAVALAHAQPLTVIGFLGNTAPAPELVAPFLEGLAAAGFVDGRNLKIEYRWAHNQADRLPALAADLVRHKAKVIVTSGGASPVRAAKAASASIPIVFLVGIDPAATGIIASLSRPGGNATGVYMMTGALNGKRLELLHQMVPSAGTVAILVHPNSPGVRDLEAEVREAAAAVGVQHLILHAATEREIDLAFEVISGNRIGALVVTNNPFFNSRRDQLVAQTVNRALPAIFEWREFADGGGLMSYGSDRSAAHRELGTYAARILQGASVLFRYLVAYVLHRLSVSLEREIPAWRWDVRRPSLCSTRLSMRN